MMAGFVQRRLLKRRQTDSMSRAGCTTKTRSEPIPLPPPFRYPTTPRLVDVDDVAVIQAVKSVLVMAGSLKRGYPDVDEDLTLIRALVDSNVPKFLADDLPLFAAIVKVG